MENKYLGNNRITVSLADGRIEEANHYYPFGGLMGDSRNAATQPYKYIGKELDRTHGLDWYDHGARHYDPVTGRWNVMDALAEKYYPWSPYVSCGDDPVNAVDPDGNNPIYNSKGDYLGSTKEGFCGTIYVYVGMENINFSDFSIDDLVGKNSDYSPYFMTFDDVVSSYTGEALQNLTTNVYNNILEHFEGIKVFGDKRFSLSTIEDGKIVFTKNDKSNFTTYHGTDKRKIRMQAHGRINSYEGTVENYATSMIVHEWYCHGVYTLGDNHKDAKGRPAPNHSKVYSIVMQDKLFYPKTTKKYKSFVQEQCDFYKKNKQ